MKKFLFSIQVLALVAMFPVCMMLALNREKVKSPSDQSATEVEIIDENGCLHDAVIDSAFPFGFLMLKSCSGTGSIQAANKIIV
ncbi:MAG: hypothetical protein EOO04_37095 [Chitinophagaceae bacterium]|nr:MAG: hypothetical protein EOO04_37095 [Chitinophagaceae bacterium]